MTATDVWKKSSYSAGNGACVQVLWKTSSYSADTNCVQWQFNRER